MWSDSHDFGALKKEWKQNDDSPSLLNKSVIPKCPVVKEIMGVFVKLLKMQFREIFYKLFMRCAHSVLFIKIMMIRYSKSPVWFKNVYFGLAVRVGNPSINSSRSWNN